MNQNNNRPTHDLCAVNGEGDEAEFTRVAPLWPTKTGGFAGSIPAGISITGRIVITKRKDQ